MSSSRKRKKLVDNVIDRDTALLNPGSPSVKASQHRRKKMSCKNSLVQRLPVEYLEEGLSDENKLAEQLKLGFNLPYDPERWQLKCISKLQEGKDVIMVAEGLALLNPERILIVICPLKALELDQAQGAIAH